MGEIIHAGAAQVTVGEEKAAGLDQLEGTSRQAASRIMAPAFCGMSGS